MNKHEEDDGQTKIKLCFLKKNDSLQAQARSEFLEHGSKEHLCENFPEKFQVMQLAPLQDSGEHKRVHRPEQLLNNAGFSSEASKMDVKVMLGHL